jgi:predicted DNA-binding antitoxin AbrB/MazE fold protein
MTSYSSRPPRVKVDLREGSSVIVTNKARPRAFAAEIMAAAEEKRQRKNKRRLELKK